MEVWSLPARRAGISQQHDSTSRVTESGTRCDVAVVAAYEWVSQLLEDILSAGGWRVIVMAPEETGRGASRTATCGIVFCDLDLPRRRRAAVRAAGIPIVYFSASKRRSEFDPPADAAGYFDLPPDREELDRLIRSIL